MAQEASGVGEVDGGVERQLLGLAHIVKKCGGEQQVAVDSPVLLTDEVAHLGDGHGVFQQAAQVGMVVDLGGRRGGEHLEEIGVSEDELKQGGVVTVADRVDVKAQKALQLLDVAIGGGQEVAGVGEHPGGAARTLVASSCGRPWYSDTLPVTSTRSPVLGACVHQVGLPDHAVHGAGAVAQLAA